MRFALALFLLIGQEGGTEFKLPVQELVLDNGMRILVYEKPDAPRAYCALYWRVGSVNERPGITGLSHFFEHMMFKGTARIGTKDPAKDAELNQAIESTMTEIRAVKLQRLEAQRRGVPLPTEAEKRREELWKKYEELVKEQQKITISEHLSKIYAANGGTGLNASTFYDRTNYYVDLPANKVELFFWLESDRFSRPVFREFYAEREVVKEERRMRTDSTPTGLINEAFGSMFWEAHPYHWPVIGWMSDIDQYTLADADAYFARHYSPQNCSAIFVGDVKADEIFALAKKYFGRLKRFTEDPEPIVTQEPEQPAEKRMNAEAFAQPSITIRWHGPSAVHADTPGLDLLAMVLDGRTGRLYRTLVEDQKLALNASAGYWGLKYGGMFHISVTPRDESKFGRIEAMIDVILDDLKSKPVTDVELQKVKNQSLASLMRDLQDIGKISSMIGQYEVNGTWRDLPEYVARLNKVTPADLKRLANTYLRDTGRNVLTIKRRKK
jgi:predicted Zn-dependent peptidase